MPALGARAALRRVGHKGADLIAPGNTTASFDAALAAGVDVIEFDVLSEHADGSGELLVVHDYEHLRRSGAAPPTLREALAHLAQPQFAAVELDIDLKLPGYELRALAALEELGLLERSLISSMYLSSLDLLRGARPQQRLGWSVPRVRRDYTNGLLTRAPALAIAAGYRALFPRVAGRFLRERRCDAIMAHWRIVTPALVRAVAGAGGELYVWTVDDPLRIAALERLGVTGVITNDPRLFARAAEAAAQDSAQAAAL
jgi:glycerophosphoryl diester phosphodiesterase